MGSATLLAGRASMDCKGSLCDLQSIMAKLRGWVES
jgi:hypothetical protein